VLLLVGGFVGLIVSGWTVCEEQLATVGSQPVVRRCRPLILSDLPVVTGLLVVLLLLLPDLAEIGIPGFISLKRRVEDQEARLAGLEVQVTQAADLSQTTVQGVDSRASALNVNVVDFHSALEAFRDKAGGDVLPSLDTSVVGPAVVPARRGQLEARLLRVWARLQPLVTWGQRVHDQRVHQQELQLELARAEGRLAIREAAYLETQTRRQDVLRAMHDDRSDVAEAARRQFALTEQETLEAARQLAKAKTDRNNLEARAQQLPGLDEVPLTRTELLALGKWYSDFEQEIKVVALAQQGVAEANPIEDTKLEDAVTLADGLLAAWDLRQSQARDSSDAEPP
jgi:hypothetical protein